MTTFATSASQQPPTSPADSILAGGGEMGALMRAFDWGATPLGPVESWPQSFRTAVRILLTSRFAMWLGWGPGLTFLYNDAYGRMTLGRKHPWALGRPTSEVWAEIWRDIGPRIETVMRTGTATWDEALLLFLERSGYPEETYHTFSYSPLTDDAGQVAGMLCVVSEETERVIGERRLDSLRELGSALAETNTEGDVLAAARRCLGANRKDLPFTLLYLSERDQTRARCRFQTGIEAGHPAAPLEIDVAAEGVWPLGEARAHGGPVVVSALPERFADLPSGDWEIPPQRATVIPISQRAQDVPAGYLVAGINPYRQFDGAYAGFFDLIAGQIASSLANARAYEEERRRAAALAELDRAKTAFFANVSHELRTPLTLLLGPSKDALEDETMSSANRGRLDLVHRNALRLLKLVNTLLDFSRIEAGRVEAAYEPTDLPAYTAELASSFRSVVEHAGLSFVVHCPPFPATAAAAYVDRDMWEKTVLNLLSNAYKHTFDGEIAISVRADGERALLEVSDSGVGVSAEQLPRIFDRFHRVPNARSRTNEGSGIGLSLVAELVSLHGGTVAAESTEGLGSCFRVSIPLGNAHLPSAQVGPARLGASTVLGAAPFVEEAARWRTADDATTDSRSGRDDGSARASAAAGRVLLADDNADMRDYVARLLEERGYDVETVGDGVAALAAARARRPDIVLSDVMMPALDGFGLLIALRADPATRDVPVVMVSARAGEEAKVHGLDTGADDYLVKPFSARELYARVGAHVRLSRERGRAQNSARAAEASLRLLVEQAPVAVAVLRGPTHRFEIANDFYCRMVARRDLIGKTVPEAFPELDLSTHVANLDRVYQTGVPFTAEEFAAPVVRSTGAVEDGYFNFVYQPLRDPTGEVEGIVVIAVEVTTQVASRASLERQGAELRGALAELSGLLDVVPVGIAISRDPACRDIRVNPAFAEQLGIRRDENASKSGPGADSLPFRVTRRGIEVPADDLPMQRAARTRMAVMAEELDIEHADGRVTRLLEYAAPLLDDAGIARGAVGAFVDITDHARLAEAERAARAAAEEASQAKTQFLTTMSHELRTPLNAIAGYAELLALGVRGPVTEEQRADLDRIRRNQRHLLALINDLLNLARIESGQVRFDMADVAVEPVLVAVETMIAPQVATKGLRYESHPCDPAVMVHADPERLSQILANLLSNAVKFTDRGGLLDLSCDATETDVSIRVRDTGRGMPTDKLDAVFAPFVQIGRGHTTDAGTGLGLSISRDLARQMGGDVTVESAIGVGSTFTVRLPRVGTPEKSGPSASRSGPASATNRAS